MDTKIPVEGQPGLYRDENTGAILNCSDLQYKKYMELREIKLKESQQMKEMKSKINEIEDLKTDLNEIKNIMKIILEKIN
jgi:hypothetical protein